MEKVKKFFNYFEEICAGSFLIATTVLVIVNVFTRYFLKTAARIYLIILGKTRLLSARTMCTPARTVFGTR